MHQHANLRPHRLHMQVGNFKQTDYYAIVVEKGALGDHLLEQMARRNNMSVRHTMNSPGFKAWKQSPMQFVVIWAHYGYKGGSMMTALGVQDMTSATLAMVMNRCEDHRSSCEVYVCGSKIVAEAVKDRIKELEVSSDPRIVRTLEHQPEGADFGVLCRIPKGDVERNDINGLIKIFDAKTVSDESLKKYAHSFILTFDGWDGDKREVFEIPEIRGYLASAAEAFPAWAMLMSTEMDCMANWFWSCCGNRVAHEGAQENQVGIQMDMPAANKMGKAALIGAKDLMTRLNIDEQSQAQYSRALAEKMMAWARPKEAEKTPTVENQEQGNVKPKDERPQTSEEVSNGYNAVILDRSEKGLATLRVLKTELPFLTKDLQTWASGTVPLLVLMGKAKGGGLYLIGATCDKDLTNRAVPFLLSKLKAKGCPIAFHIAADPEKESKLRAAVDLIEHMAA